MKITVLEESESSFRLSFDGTEIVLGTADLKELLLQVTGVLAPSSPLARKADQHRRDFLARLTAAEDIGLQALIQTADHDDIVVLLKVADEDSDLRAKLFRNMSEKSRKMFLEDLDFRFHDAAPAALVHAALDRIEKVVGELEDDGRPVY